MKLWVPGRTVAMWAMLGMGAVGQAQASPAGADSAPHLVLSESEHDLGRLPPTAAHATFQVAVRNGGDQPLVVRKVRTSCVCLRAELAAAAIAPAGEAMLTLQIDPPTIDEDVEEEVLIYSNDPIRPVSKLQITGSVGTAIRLIPQQAFPVGPVSRDMLSQMRVPAIQLAAADGKPLGTVRVTTSNPSIRAEAHPGEYGVYDVVIKIADTIPLGRIDAAVKVETDHPTTRSFEIPILGSIVGELDTAGRRLDFGFVKEGRPASATMKLTNRGRREIKILSAKAQLPVPAEAWVLPEGRDFKVVVSIQSAPAFTRLEGQVEIRTDHPDEPVLRIPIAGGILADRPFERTAIDGSDARLMAIVNDVLARGERITADQFFAEVLDGVRDERATSLLLRALAEGVLPARMRAVQLLSEFKTPEVLDRLRDAITDDQEGFVRRLAVAAYARAMGKAAVPFLMMALQDDDAWVREDSATYLGKIGDIRAIPALRAALADRNAEAAEAVRSALTSLQVSARQQ